MLTEAQLGLVELLVSDGVQVIDLSTSPRPVPQPLQDAGFCAYADRLQFAPESPDRRSDWLRTEAGRCIPEIYALALLHFGTLLQDNKVMEPFWHEGGVQLRRASHVRNKYGVRAGSREYNRRYYQDPSRVEANRERARKTAAQQRALVKKAKEIVEEQELRALAKAILMPDGRRGHIEDRIFDQIVERAKRLALTNGTDVDTELRKMSAQWEQIDEIAEGNLNFSVDSDSSI